MSISPAEIRATVEAAITAALGPAADPAPDKPLRVSRLAWDKFPGADGNDVEAYGFAVGAPSTTPLQSRQQPPGFPAQTTIAVRWTYRLRADAHVADYDLGLAQETAIIAVVSATDSLDMQRPRLVPPITRRVDADGTLLVGDLSFVVTHVHPL